MTVINFISSKSTSEEHAMDSKSDKIEVMVYDKANEVIDKNFESLFNRYYIGLQTSIRGGDFTVDCINLLHYKSYKMKFKFAMKIMGHVQIL